MVEGIEKNSAACRHCSFAVSRFNLVFTFSTHTTNQRLGVWFSVIVVNTGKSGFLVAATVPRCSVG